jgi:hypothetical protein
MTVLLLPDSQPGNIDSSAPGESIGVGVARVEADRHYAFFMHLLIGLVRHVIESRYRGEQLPRSTRLSNPCPQPFGGRGLCGCYVGKAPDDVGNQEPTLAAEKLISPPFPFYLHVGTRTTMCLVFCEYGLSNGAIFVYACDT